MAKKLIDADEFIAQAERREKYLILQYKKTDDKKYYHRLDELRRAEQYVREISVSDINPYLRKHIKFKEENDAGI